MDDGVSVREQDVHSLQDRCMKVVCRQHNSRARDPMTRLRSYYGMLAVRAARSRAAVQDLDPSRVTAGRREALAVRADALSHASTDFTITHHSSVLLQPSSSISTTRVQHQESVTCHVTFVT